MKLQTRGSQRNEVLKKKGEKEGDGPEMVRTTFEGNHQEKSQTTRVA